MQLRRLLTGGIWFATTVAATGMVWPATSVVARDVTDRPAPVIAQREVVEALQEQAPAPVTQPVVRAPEPPLDGATPPVGDDAGAVDAAAGARSGDHAPSAVDPHDHDRHQGPAHHGSQPPGHGDVPDRRRRGDGDVCRLLHPPGRSHAGGRPAVDVLDRGPATVDVHFVGRSGAEDRIRVVCLGNRALRVPDQHQAPGATGGSR